MDSPRIGEVPSEVRNSGGLSNFACRLPSAERRRIKRNHLVEQVAEEVSFLTPWRILTRVITLFALLALAGFIYTGFGNDAFSSIFFTQKVTDYGIVIDAGSHGSRLHLYQWPARIHDPVHPLSGPISFPDEILSLNVSPGISSMGAEGKDPDQAGEICIKPLLSQLMVELTSRGIPQEKWPSFPIFLKATAGMRDLDILTRSRIMNSIRRYLADDVNLLYIQLIKRIFMH